MWKFLFSINYSIIHLLLRSFAKIRKNEFERCRKILWKSVNSHTSTDKISFVKLKDKFTPDRRQQTPPTLNLYQIRNIKGHISFPFPYMVQNQFKFFKNMELSSEKNIWCILSRNKVTCSYIVIKRLFINFIKINRCYIWMMFTKMPVTNHRSVP